MLGILICDLRINNCFKNKFSPLNRSSLTFFKEQYNIL
mgnify:CR=1 FL=1